MKCSLLIDQGESNGNCKKISPKKSRISEKGCPSKESSEKGSGQKSSCEESSEKGSSEKSRCQKACSKESSQEAGCEESCESTRCQGGTCCSDYFEPASRLAVSYVKQALISPLIGFQARCRKAPGFFFERAPSRIKNHKPVARILFCSIGRFDRHRQHHAYFGARSNRRTLCAVVTGVNDTPNYRLVLQIH